MEENTSGLGEKAVVPSELKGGWNWGAFLLNWIWGIGNSTFIAFLCFVPFVGWIMMFVLGAKGNEWAWKNKRWESIEHFRKVQRTWTLWGIGVLVVSILLMIIMGIVMAIAMAKYGNSMQNSEIGQELGKLEQQYDPAADKGESSAIGDEDASEDAQSEADSESDPEADRLANTPAFDMALEKVSGNDKIMAKLGDNAEYKDLTGSADENHAEYNFTVAGDKAGGTVHVTAANKKGAWVIESATIDLGNGKPVNLNK